MRIGELFVALGFDVDDKKLKDFNEEVKSGMTGLLKMAGVVSGAAFAVNAFVSGAVQQSVALKNFREETGYASDDVERFYNVIGRLNENVTLDQTVSAFRALSDTISQAKFGQGAIGQAGMLGLANLGAMTPMEVIRRLRENYARNVEQYGADRTRDLMSELGLTSEFIQSIKATNQEFDTLFNKPILGAENRNRLEEIAEAQKELSFQWQLLRGELSAEISDEIVLFLNNLIPAVIEVAKNFKALGSAISDAFNGLSPEQQKMLLSAAVALGAGMAAAFAPVTTALVTILALVNEIGKAMRGESGLVDDIADYQLKLTEYLLGGKLDNTGLPKPAMAVNTDFSRMAARGDFTVNNVWNIASNGDALTLSEMIAQKEKQVLVPVISQQTRGVVQ